MVLLRTVLEHVTSVDLESVWALVNAMVTAIPHNPQTFGVTTTIVHRVIRKPIVVGLIAMVLVRQLFNALNTVLLVAVSGV